MEEKHHAEAAAEEVQVPVINAQEKLNEIIEQLKTKYPQISVSEQQDIIVPAADLMIFMEDLKKTYSFDFLTNLTAADYPKDQKFEVVYNVSSIEYGYTLLVKAEINRDNPELPSVFPIWGGANWQEREVYDLLGIVFTGHPNLKRILLHDTFEGYPLRKDYEWEGGRQ